MFESPLIAQPPELTSRSIHHSFDDPDVFIEFDETEPFPPSFEQLQPPDDFWEGELSEVDGSSSDWSYLHLLGSGLDPGPTLGDL